MLEIIIIVLLVLWLFGWIGPSVVHFVPNTGVYIHLLLLVALIVLVVRLIRGTPL